MRITDFDIQAAPNIWGTRTGADIGGTAPSDYGITQGTIDSPTAAIFRTSGEPFTDWLGYSARTIPPGATACLFEFDLWLDEQVAAAAQALEFDWKGNVRGLMRDLSGQINIEEGSGGFWVWQVVKDNDWTDAVKIPALTPRTKHHMAIASSFEADTFSQHLIKVDGDLYVVPSELAGQPAQPITPEQWALMVANVQVQLDANAIGGNYAIQIDGMHLTWS
jgi:hypothetical protein